MSDQSNPAVGVVSVTPSDTVDISQKNIRALWIGTGGDVAVVCYDDSTAVHKNVPSGFPLPVSVKRVKATGTTAQNIVAWY